jgi:hypothetical protein
MRYQIGHSAGDQSEMVIDGKVSVRMQASLRRGQERGMRAALLRRGTKRRKLLVPLKSEQKETSDVEKVWTET